MKKKEYVDAINEIKADEELKKKVLEKTSEKRYNRKAYTRFATAIIIFVIAISIAIPININKSEVTPIEIIEENNGLPKIETFDNLYNIMKDKKSSFYETNDVIISADSLAESSIESSKAEYSTTNVQVEGVDEADIVKTDGTCIYYISSTKIVLVDAKDSSNLQVASEIKYSEEERFYPTELYIYGNKLIVIGQKKANRYNTLMEVDSAYPIMDGNKTIAKVYNIENKTNPNLEREIEVDGAYLSSRMIDDNIYFIANKYIYTYLFNKDISELDEEMFKPRYYDTISSTEEKSISYNDIYYFPESEDASYLSVVGFNVNNNEEANINTYLGAGNEIYSSKDNLYITRVKYEYKDENLYGYYNNYDLNTYVYKFKLENAKATYQVAGSVPGRILNQFSMDEKDGYFRIATTNSTDWSSETNTNNLYVLNDKLEMVGKIENLAKGEKIYSVRFMDNRAYMVTFVETDPLFVIDLSNPEDPTVLGELKIPGYSKYLHPYDETHIIGFGENTTTNSYGGVVTDGMKMALFDVTDPNNPKELYSVDIGEKGTYSEILNNHKALLFSKEKNIIAFPISISEEAGNYRTKLKFQGAIVYGLDLENGFNQKGTIAHMQIQDGYRDYDYTKAVERIVYINDSLYTLSESLIKSTNINNMQEEGSVEIEVEE